MKRIYSLSVVTLLAAASAVSAAEAVDFDKQIRPILELNCVGCHHEGSDKGELRLDIKAGALDRKSVV